MKYHRWQRITGPILLIVGIGLLGCVPQAEPKAEVNELAATIPVTRTADKENPTSIPSVWPTLTPISGIVDGPSGMPFAPKSLDDVRCGKFENEGEKTSYWVDDFIPGESTIDDLLQVRGLRTAGEPSREGLWQYANDGGYNILFFLDGVLGGKIEPRWHLGDIISHYGKPTQVTWEVLNPPGTLAADSTTLFFPQSNAIFSAEGQITYFYENAEFFGTVFMPADYEKLYEEYGKTTSITDLIQHFPWPCD
jgi:hypothetical protein